VQSSLSHLCLHEVHGHRRSVILSGGARAESILPFDAPTPLREVNPDETFPFYEDRSIRPDPIDLRQTFPAQAFGMKLTVNMRPKHTATLEDLIANVGDEIMVLSEIGMDEFEILLDSGPWCRILRFAGNLDDGGFDPRWLSGDYCKDLTSHMLVAADASLNTDNDQPHSKPFALHKSFVDVADLLNATVRMTDITLRIPAAIGESLRSCEIVVKANEAVLTISSALPRTLLAGDTSTPESLEFPNDPSDCICNLPSEDSKVSVTLRCQQKIKGFTVQALPVLPIFPSILPQQLLLSTDMTLHLCVEGEPSFPTSNVSQFSRIFALTSIFVHRLDMNIDYDLVVAMACTLSDHHATIQENLLRFISRREADNATYPVLPVKDATKPNSLHYLPYVEEMLGSLGMTTNALSVVLGVRVLGTRIRHWRSRVPRCLPLSSSLPISGENLLSLLLVDAVLNDIDASFEVTECSGDGRCIGKVVCTELRIRICDFKRTLESDSWWCASEAQSKEFEDQMITIYECSPKSRAHAIALRIEEGRQATRAWALSAEASSGILHCYVEELEMIGLLVVDALLMLTPIGAGPVAENSEALDMGSSLTNLPDARGVHATRKSKEFASFETKVNGLLRILSVPVDLVLLRSSINDFGIRLPPEDFELKVERCDFFASYFGAEIVELPSLFGVYAQQQEKWSSLVLNRDKGFFHSLRSNVSVARASRSSEVDQNDEASAKLTTESPGSDAANILLQTAFRCREVFDRSGRLLANSRRSANRTSKDDAVSLKPDSSTNILLLKTHFTELQRTVARNAHILRSIEASKGREIADLRMALFVKENERTAALTVTSSEQAGWLRIGGPSRSGQRGLMSCIFWPYWAVLRRNVLVLYSGPGQVIILLTRLL
jgi:hypothetical protein